MLPSVRLTSNWPVVVLLQGRWPRTRTRRSWTSCARTRAPGSSSGWRRARTTAEMWSSAQPRWVGASLAEILSEKNQKFWENNHLVRFSKNMIMSRVCKPSDALLVWLLTWRSRLVTGSGLWRTVISWPGRRRSSRSWSPTSRSAPTSTSWLAVTVSVLPRISSVTVKRTVLMVQMRTFAVRHYYFPPDQ